MKRIAEALAARSQPVSLFFRNDDAGWAQDALDHQLDIFAARAMPIDLAVIPVALNNEGARRLDQWRTDHPGIGLHQHGYAHFNHEGESDRKCEFGPTRPHERQIADIVGGHMRLVSMLGALDPIFTPPWNRCSLQTANALPNHGFALVSDDGALARAGCDAPGLPVSFDWERHRRSGKLIADLAQHVSTAGPTIGIMLHHATMDRCARETLGEFLDVLSVCDQAQIFPMRQWIGKTA